MNEQDILNAVKSGISDAFITLYEDKIGFSQSLFKAIERGTESSMIKKEK